MPTDIVLENVVIRYPHLAEMWTGSQTIAADYQAQIVLPQTFAQWQPLQDAVNEAIAGKFGANVPANLKLPWLDQFLQPNVQKDGPYQGCYWINAKGKGTKPGVVGPDGQTIPDLKIKELIFSGCIVNVYINFYAYQVSGAGVAAALQGVQLVNNQVERIADAGRDITQVFKAIPGAPPMTAPPPQQPQQPAPGPGVAPTAPPWGG